MASVFDISVASTAGQTASPSGVVRGDTAGDAPPGLWPPARSPVRDGRPAAAAVLPTALGGVGAATA